MEILKEKLRIRKLLAQYFHVPLLPEVPSVVKAPQRFLQALLPKKPDLPLILAHLRTGNKIEAGLCGYKSIFIYSLSHQVI